MTPAQTDYNWLINIIDSCTNSFHFDGVDVLIQLFHAKHNNAPLTECLTGQRILHFNNVHSILN